MIKNRVLSLRTQTGATSRLLEGLVRRLDRENSFNPSICRKDTRWYIAVRHLGDTGSRPFEASLVTYDTLSRNFFSTNLSQHVSHFGVDVVADPKLFEIRDEVWVTFNSGWSKTRNALYLMKVSPYLSNPIEVDYEHRQSVEKNWAFFARGSSLQALYSLNPLRVLTSQFPAEGDQCLHFFDSGSPLEKPNFGSGLTIGTPAVPMGDRLCLVGHEKRFLFGYRAYVGRLASVLGDDSDLRLQVSDRRLFHSFPSLLGSTKKFNKNLFSCTYFSGIAALGDTRLVLAYGINDLSYGFAEVLVEEL